MLDSRYLLGLLAAFGLLATVAQAQVTGNAAPAPNDPEAYVKLGMQDGSRGDLNGAMDAFNSAIQLNPKWAPAYEKRGSVLLQLGKFDDAVADFTHAIQIDPTYRDAYYNRGIAEGGQTQFEAAIDDFSRIIQLDPKDVEAYASRGFARYFKDDFDGAIADTTQALALNPNLPASYYTRGLACRNKKDAAGETANFQKSADAGFAYSALWLWIANMEAGQAATAQASLTNFFNQHTISSDSWARHLGDFLLGKIKQDNLLGLAAQDDPALGHVGEAWFFIGISQRARGDLKSAQASFTQAAASGSKQSVEYIEAQRELAKMQNP